MAGHSPFEPVLRDVLPVPVVQGSPSVHYQVDPGLRWLVFRVENEIGEPHVFQELRQKIN